MERVMMQNNVDIIPCIVIPDKSFLVGALYGMNAARKRIEEDPKPLLNNEEVSENSSEIYLGHWLELHCAKCGSFYTFNDPNEIPETNFICKYKESSDKEECGNHVIIYGIGDPNLWRIGQMTFV